MSRPDDSQELIKKCVALLGKIFTEIGNVCVYQQEALLVQALVPKYRRLLQALPAAPGQVEQLRRLLDSAQSLQDLIRWLGPDWVQVCCDWSVRKPVKDLAQGMGTMTDCLKRLGCDPVLPFAPTDPSIIADYQVVHTAFANGDKTNPRVAARLRSVTVVLGEFGAAPGLFDDLFQGSSITIVKREDFQIEKKIGSGATGQVFVARQLSANRRVAIKQLNAVELDKWEKRCFRREIEALSSLRHPYLVEFIGATDVSPYWIVTAFMSGGALYYRLSERPPLSGTRKTIIAYDVAEGMAFLHSRGMIHRDLKSLNVLLDDAGEPCICDFGVTRMVDADRAMTGIMGTYHYMAPEVIRKAKCNIKADVFSFGMVLWEMVMPKVPFS